MVHGYDLISLHVGKHIINLFFQERFRLEVPPARQLDLRRFEVNDRSLVARFLGVHLSDICR